MGVCFMVQVLPVGRFGQKKNDGTPCRFLMTYACCVSITRASTPIFGLSRKPETRGLGLLSPPVNIITQEFYDFSGGFPIQTPFAKAFQYTNHMERLAEGRIVAKYSLS